MALIASLLLVQVVLGAAANVPSVDSEAPVRRHVKSIDGDDKVIHARRMPKEEPARSVRVGSKPKQHRAKQSQPFDWILGDKSPRQHGAVNTSATETPESTPFKAFRSNVPMIIHHLGNTAAMAVGNKILDHQGDVPASPRLFCYAFVRPPEDKGPEKHVSELRRMLAHCDGSAMYSNFDDPTLGITKAHDGATGGNAKSAAQFLSVYGVLAHSDELQAYDWIVDLESDHFVQPKVLKTALHGHSSSQAIMLLNGNVRVLSKGLLQEIKKQWADVSQRRENGCPVWAPVPLHQNCQGDVTMPCISAAMEKGSVQVNKLQGSFFEMQSMGMDWGSEDKQVRQMEYFLNLSSELAGSLTEDFAGCPSGFLQRLRNSRSSEGLTKRMADLLDTIIDIHSYCRDTPMVTPRNGSHHETVSTFAAK